jgi:hypothetical protein
MRILRSISVAAALMLGMSSAHALCPDGAVFDAEATACVTSTNNFGPFTTSMVDACRNAGAGASCTATYPYLVNGKTVNLPRWSRSFAQSLRGTGSCPVGSVRSATYGGHCFEQGTNVPNSVLGNFTAEEVSICESLSGGAACYLNRWDAAFYLRVKGTAAPQPAAGNKYGAWLFYADQLGKTHTQIADQLKAQGVKRIFIKIADGASACSLFPDACMKSTTDIYRARGIEPWAWAYNRPNDNAAQADALYQAAKYGYVGFVSDVETEFNNQTTAIDALFQAFQAARDRAKAAGFIAGTAASFPIGATSWGNPQSQGMRVDLIDKYVDFHMPQVYLEVWGSSYMAEPKKWIEATNCEYRNMGAAKPIWNIVSTEYDTITGPQLEAFMTAAGPNASIWRIPGGGTPTSIWSDWAQIDWSRNSFTESNCGAGNNKVTNYLSSPSVPVPTPVVPYWSQLANASNPGGTCSVTSMAMITDFFGLTSAASLGQRTPDYLNNRFGVRQTVPTLADIFNTLAAEKGSALRDRGTVSGTFDQLRQRASQGKPTIVHGWFTNPGHIMVVIGYDGVNYTVHDPYGKWLLTTGAYDTSVSGKNQKYPKAAFERVINDNGMGNDLWLHIFE